MDVTIIVATFGERSWLELAHHRAIPSAEAQHPTALVVHHGATLADARNDAAILSRTEWLCFLDADDELELGYLEQMAEAPGDLRAPSIRYVVDDDELPAPLNLAGRDIDVINPCVIGTLVRREQFIAVGGFWRERAWEDWSLFRRCWLDGATIVHVPRAVYRAHVNPAGRNTTVDRPQQLHREIVRSHARWKEARTP